MVDVKDAFISAKEISQVLGIGMTKAYAIIKAYNVLWVFSTRHENTIKFTE